MGGFGTFFSSNDLNLEDLKEIEKFASYSPAYDFPHNPSNDEIKDLFPINYSYYRFKNSNKIAVLHSKYTGRCNHTPDRFGNFISHSIILDFTDYLNIPAVFDKYKFRNSLTIEEENNFTEETNELIYTSSTINYNYYADYLLKNNNSLNSFLKILDLLIDGWLNDSQKNISILANKEDNKDIIFALYTLLPPFLINKFSFATYVNNPNKYPFQISGIIKESGISSLDSNYFNLIEVDKLLEYNPQNEFTKYFCGLIENQKYSYEVLIVVINDHNITKIGKSLNSIPKSIEFFENIKNKSVDDYKKIITSDLSIKIKDKAEVESKKLNPALYIDILVEKFNKISIYNHKEFIVNIKSFSDKYFANDSFFRGEHFFSFYSKAKEKINLNYKSLISIDFLNEFDLNNQLDIEQELAIVDTWIVKNEFGKDDLIKLLKKYDIYIKKENMLNLFKNKKRIEFENLLKEGKLKSILLNGNDDFKDLDKKDKFDILIELIWFENIKNKFDLTFTEYKKLTKEYIYDSLIEFWCKFFKTKLNEDDNDKHSLSYLKRHFILNSLKEDYIIEVIKKNDFTDFEKLWILDYTSQKSLYLNDDIKDLITAKSRRWL